MALWLAVFFAVTLGSQGQPNFTGTWVLDNARSGPEPTIWTQRRPGGFVLSQTADELLLDTGDGSIFGVPKLVLDGSLRYRLDGSSIEVVDRTLGDLPGFERKIRTQASWDGSRLVTRSTQFHIGADGAKDGVTRVLVFSLLPDGSIKVDRTGYRGLQGRQLFVTVLPKYSHRGMLEDDLVYARDTAFYTKLP